MKKVQSFLFATVLAALFVSCQSGTETKQILSNSDTRKDIMNTIANDSSMHIEMMAAMMNGKMMKNNHASMMKMMKENPGMMQTMMGDMMEMCKNDSTMMGGMCKTMMANPQMMDIMNKMKATDPMKNMDHKLHH